MTYVDLAFAAVPRELWPAERGGTNALIRALLKPFPGGSFREDDPTVEPMEVFAERYAAAPRGERAALARERGYSGTHAALNAIYRWRRRGGS